MCCIWFPHYPRATVELKIWINIWYYQSLHVSVCQCVVSECSASDKEPSVVGACRLSQITGLESRGHGRAEQRLTQSAGQRADKGLWVNFQRALLVCPFPVAVGPADVRRVKYTHSDRQAWRPYGLWCGARWTGCDPSRQHHSGEKAVCLYYSPSQPGCCRYDL